MTNPSLRPVEEFPGSPENLRALLVLLDGWRCCGSPSLCGASCEDDELSAILARSHWVVSKHVS
jgi:hypothetical protein